MGCMSVRVLFVLFFLSGMTSANAEDAPDWGTETLSGSWGGVRPSLFEKGVAMDLTHKSDIMSNTSGGLKRGSLRLSNTEMAISMDMDKLAGWNATSAYIQYHIQHGKQHKDFNGSYVGSFAGVSNIETGTNTGQFFQVWLQKNSADDTLSVLAGLYAIDSEFYVTETSGLFLQPPYGMSAEMAQTGQNGPPVFPMGALGVRIRYSLPDFYFQGVVTDGVPGDPNNPHGTHVKLGKGDGTLTVAEIGYVPKGEGHAASKTAIGLWSYSARADDLVDVDALGKPIRRRDQGVYFLAERTLYAEQNDPAQGLSGFVRFGTANKDINRGLADGAPTVDWSGSLGLIYQGLLDGRDGDTAGIAVTTSHASNKYQQLSGSDTSEVVIELTYRALLQPWLALQTSVQRIVNPGMDKALEDASVIGVRFELSI